MALFDSGPQPKPELVGSDAATRALSVIAVENDFVTGVYEKLAAIYDVTFGITLHPGRVSAIKRLAISPGERLLEVGVGTGINASMLPSDAVVTGIDMSKKMLERARERFVRKGVTNVRLMQMDAARMTFPDDAFDVVYAPFLISVVPDPVAVAREMHRVCRPGGRVVILNHFLSETKWLAAIERVISPFTVHMGFRSDLDLPAFLAQADLRPVSVEKVSLMRTWSLVTCIKD
jgi:phosphatidylethanolamine/phosphatidyl-N-methylethanolamine N-methyltransferase